MSAGSAGSVGSTEGRPRVVVVTGASSGIGLALAHELATRGDHLVLMARSPEPLEKAARECRSAGAASVLTVPVDVSDAAAVDRAVDQVHARHPRLDVVVQSAGVVAYGRVEDVPSQVFDQVIATNVLGSVNVVRAVLPAMREDDHGSLYLLGSVIGSLGVATMTPYVVSKWGVRALARQLQLENRDRRGVHVTLVTPGGIDTPIYTQAANYTGRVGKPPPPVYRPETVAKAIADSLDRPPRTLNVGVANPLMAAGFAVLPRLYDLLVGPLFAVLARERATVQATPGNVLEPRPEANALRGRHPGATRSPS